MKVVVTFKNPDAVFYAQQDLAADGATRDELERFEELVSDYFRYGEYCDVEFDLKTGEVTLVPCCP